MTELFSNEKLARLQAVTLDPEFPAAAQRRFLGLSLADILEQPLDESARFELATLGELAELLASALIVHWREANHVRAEAREAMRDTGFDDMPVEEVCCRFRGR